MAGALAARPVQRQRQGDRPAAEMLPGRAGRGHHAHHRRAGSAQVAPNQHDLARRPCAHCSRAALLALHEPVAVDPQAAAFVGSLVADHAPRRSGLLDVRRPELDGAGKTDDSSTVLDFLLQGGSGAAQGGLPPPLRIFAPSFGALATSSAALVHFLADDGLRALAHHSAGSFTRLFPSSCVRGNRESRSSNATPSMKAAT